MDQQAFEKLVVDVSKHFETPEALVAHRELTRDQKLALLRQWEYDLHLLQVATEENMSSGAPQGNNQGNNAENIRRIRAAAETLGAGTDTEGGADKTGAVIKGRKAAAR